MENIKKLKYLHSLKHVFRDNDVLGKLETSAEHSRSSLVLADYFMNIMNLKIDRLKVYELLMYHDIVEIEAGDIPLCNENLSKNKKDVELKAMKKLMSKMPKALKDKYEELFHEFEKVKTLESKFANAIDKLDADIYALDSSLESFKWYTEELIRRKKQEPHYSQFPEINEMFEKIILLFKQRGVI